MNEVTIIRFDSGDERAIMEARQAWLEEFRPGSTIDVLPALGGPDPAGKMTMHRLHPEFVSYLRVKGFSFDLI
jgi:hypothetical protein